MTERFADAARGALWSQPGRATRAVVDLDAVRANLDVLRADSSSDAGVLAVVKANAYGHGAVMVARRAVQSGVSAIGVATIGEGCQLRLAGLEIPIIVLGPSDPSEAPDAADLDLTVAIGSAATMDAIASILEPTNVSLDVHLKVDSGMKRFGADESELPELVAAANRAASIHVTGVFSHFARADERDRTPTVRQAARFAEAANRAEELLHRRLTRHVANSAASLAASDLHLDLIRPGIGMYGLDAGPSERAGELIPALSVVSRVRRDFELSEGDEVSYGGDYRASRRERAALIPIGYADGYSRRLSGRGWMRIGGDQAPVRGRVCMDQTVVGIEHSVPEGEMVGVLGPFGNGPSAKELASLIGTIDYEVVATLSPRVPRYFWEDGRFVAVLDERGLRLI